MKLSSRPPTCGEADQIKGGMQRIAGLHALNRLEITHIYAYLDGLMFAFDSIYDKTIMVWWSETVVLHMRVKFKINVQEFQIEAVVDPRTP